MPLSYNMPPQLNEIKQQIPLMFGLSEIDNFIRSELIFVLGSICHSNILVSFTNV